MAPADGLSFGPQRPPRCRGSARQCDGSSWLRDPKGYGVIIGSVRADGFQRLEIPDVFRIVPRSDPLDDEPTVVWKQRCGRRESAENLHRRRHGIIIGVVVASQIHPDFVVTPAPQRDELL